MTMTRKYLKQWAREEVIDAIDDMIKHKLKHAIPYLPTEESVALLKERNRVAVILGFSRVQSIKV